MSAAQITAYYLSFLEEQIRTCSKYRNELCQLPHSGARELLLNEQAEIERKIRDLESRRNQLICDPNNKADNSNVSDYLDDGLVLCKCGDTLRIEEHWDHCKHDFGHEAGLQHQKWCVEMAI